MKKKGNRANTSNRTNEPKFKPGPWKYDPRTNEILNDNRYPIAEYVLELENGNLIAAAPEMYDTLAGCESSLDIVLKDETTPEYIKEIVQDIILTISHTLQKARGEQEE